MRHGTIEIRATMLEPLHHGAGASGNTARLRKDEVILPDGSRAWVPFWSGNAMKHMLRNAGALYALEALGVQPGSLSTPVVHLLFAGGHLRKTGSAAVDLAQARRLADLMPILAICGYSAGNYMQDSRMRVSKLHLVCAENAWRLPPDLRDAPQALMPCGEFVGEEMGTRMEPTGRSEVRAYLSSGDATRRDQQATLALERSRSGEVVEKSEDTAQMIYEHEVILPGARLWGRIDYHGMRDMEILALQSAFYRACAGTRDGAFIYRLGARSSIGWGTALVTLLGRELVFTAPREGEPEAMAIAQREGLSTYDAHLASHAQEILDLLERAAA